MKEITKYLNITLHFYNLNQFLTQPLIDPDGDLQLVSEIESIYVNHDGIFERNEFKRQEKDWDQSNNTIDSIFYKHISDTVICKYIFSMRVSPKPCPIIKNDKHRVKFFKLINYELNEYLLSEWWMHHVDVNGVEFDNIYAAMNYGYELVKEEMLKLESGDINEGNN